tara:strand:+ start:385 stop:1602 length:1218 start_codon:yes stop_codon:yes gene_type:complete
MAENKKEATVKETVEAPMGDEVKVKEQPKPKRMKNLGKQDETIKVDLSKPKEEEKVEEPKDVQPEEKTDDKVIEEVQEKVEEEKVEKKEEETEQPVLEEVTEEKTNETVEQKVETVEETVKEAVKESKETGEKLPENIQKVIDFMNETGGDLEDYVKLNQDYSKYDDMSILHEYYRQTKPHLTQDERNFLIEDSFSIDEEIDEERDIKRKKLAFKEQVANAKTHMDGLKSKYYKEIKAGVKLTSDQQEAIDFFNTHNEEREKVVQLQNERKSIFQQKTDSVFNDKFKGFEFEVGDKKYRYNVKDVNKTKTTQSDINNFVKQFVDKQNNMDDAAGYHKSLFTAMNADAIANHFYEQGKADALKSSMTTSKNVDMTPRQGHQETSTGGLKYKVVGDDSSKLRFKIKN